ncbi:TetR/AcrR family transcriptional regulator [Agromyces aureus]|uniref:TetR family transcriptional regulator n=1 Tax=Agromyces aureus TaxID=453304 RepID=A0A191WGN5_9MICO|nr:TetR/AcrR family transcriptional regulator [Agromyces aureus]ANJ27460.1 TetR family transcriptional regulator [Agromyces aureus]
MPTPARTSLAAIVDAGRDLLERTGLDGLTMQAVAERVGVRAPSLYKRVSGREGLVALVVDATVRDLGVAADRAAAEAGDDPRARLRALAIAVRAFAHERPVAFRVVFAPGAELRLEPASLAAASESVLGAAADLAGERHALDAARTFTAWATGFVSMELAGAFRLGGDVDRAFAFGVDALVGAVEAAAAPETPRGDHRP